MDSEYLRPLIEDGYLRVRLAQARALGHVLAWFQARKEREGTWVDVVIATSTEYLVQNGPKSAAMFEDAGEAMRFWSQERAIAEEEGRLLDSWRA